MLTMFFDKVYDSYFVFLRVCYGILLWLLICILRVLIGNKYSSMNINYREIFLTKINSKIEEPKLVDYVTSTLNKYLLCHLAQSWSDDKELSSRADVIGWNSF